MVENVRFLNGLPNHVIRQFENWEKESEKSDVGISGVWYSDGYCAILSD